MTPKCRTNKHIKSKYRLTGVRFSHWRGRVKGFERAEKENGRVQWSVSERVIISGFVYLFAWNEFCVFSIKWKMGRWKKIKTFCFCVLHLCRILGGMGGFGVKWRFCPRWLRFLCVGWSWTRVHNWDVWGFCGAKVKRPYPSLHLTVVKKISPELSTAIAYGSGRWNLIPPRWINSKISTLSISKL